MGQEQHIIFHDIPCRTLDFKLCTCILRGKKDYTKLKRVLKSWWMFIMGFKTMSEIAGRYGNIWSLDSLPLNSLKNTHI